MLEKLNLLRDLATFAERNCAPQFFEIDDVVQVAWISDHAVANFRKEYDFIQVLDRLKLHSGPTLKRVACLREWLTRASKFSDNGFWARVHPTRRYYDFGTQTQRFQVHDFRDFSMISVHWYCVEPVDSLQLIRAIKQSIQKVS